jgi:hypothetical protein
VSRSQQIGLSKTKYLAGLQCEKRLWMSCREPGLGAEPNAGTLAVMEMGDEVGKRAHLLFPGGVLVAEEHWQHAEAMRCTRELLRDANVPAIFEAAFEYEGVRIRADVLERLGDGRFGLREVKASGSMKGHHLDDLAVQCFVLEGCGLPPGSVELVHVNRDYVRGEGKIDWPRFFARENCAAQVASRLSALPGQLEAMHAVAARDAAPAIEPSQHCSNPFGCEFWEHCTRDKPPDWIHYLPRLRAPQREALRQAGHERISLLPDDVALTPLQARVRDALRGGRPLVSEALGEALRALAPPLWYLDFETMNPTIPLYAGTSPYEMIPFQWSLHRLEPDGELSHQEFLASGRGDPRRACAESLIAALGADTAPVAAYSRFEQTQIAGLMRAFPELEDALYDITERLVDIHALTRAHVYHPNFRGSFSIKTVAPALAPGFGYGDLDGVAEGVAASAAFLRVVRGELEPSEERRLRKALLAYCRRDTLALVEVHRALRALASPA